MNNTVEIVGLTRRYGSRRGIENVSLLINEGEIVGLLGPNGCGKTTLIKLVMGLLQPDEGSVSILGLKPTEAHHLVSYLPEQTYLSDWMTMEEAFSIFEDFYRDFDLSLIHI